MSVRVMTAAWAVNLPAGDKLVLLALADCANDEGHCWPGLASLVEKTGRCRRSLQESLRALVLAGVDDLNLQHDPMHQLAIAKAKAKFENLYVDWTHS